MVVFHEAFHPSVCPIIHPSKFLIPKEEEDGRGGGGQMAIATTTTITKHPILLWS